MDAVGLAIPGLNTLDLGSLETRPQTGGQQTETHVFSGVAEWQQNHMFKAFFTYKIKGARYKIYGSKDSQLSPAWVKPASTVEAGNVWQEQSAYYRLGGGGVGLRIAIIFFYYGKACRTPGSS